MLDSDNENELLNDVDYLDLMKLLSHPESESVQSDHSNVKAQNFANFRSGASVTGTVRLRCLGFKRLKRSFADRCRNPGMGSVETPAQVMEPALFS